MRPERQATGPILWVVTQLGQFLGDGYREIRGLISSNTPNSLKKVLTGSLLALILALLAVTVIASQIHPAVAISAVACVLMIVYGRTLFQRLAFFAGYFVCGFILFIGAGLIAVVPIEKDYPLLAKVIAVILFVVLCLLIPALLAMRPRQAIVGGSGSSIGQGGEMRRPALTFADVGGLEDAKKQIRELVQANLEGRTLGQYGVYRNGILLHGPRGTGKTFLAEAVAGELGLKYLMISGASFHHKWVGETENRISALFEEANANRPALLFIDELDALGARRQQLGEGDDAGGAARGVQLRDHPANELHRQRPLQTRSGPDGGYELL